MQFKEVERPGDVMSDFEEQFLETLKTGKALAISLDDVSYRTLTNRLQTIIRKHTNLRQRSRKDGGVVIVWAEQAGPGNEGT